MIALTTMTLVALASTAEVDDIKTFHLLPAPSAEPDIRLGVPYTFGTHDFAARMARGEVKLNTKSLQVLSGRFSVRIDSLVTGNKTIECHTREALGLDYRKSRFPREHVCQDNKIPASGNDAVVFPEITFEAKESRLIDGGARLSPGKGVRLEIRGRWSIHGVARDDKVEIEVAPSTTRAQAAILIATGHATIRLSDYGVRVKPALFIKAGDEVSLDFHLSFDDGR